MAATHLVFRRCREAIGTTTMATSAMKASVAIGGVPRPLVQTAHGTGTSTPAVTTSLGTPAAYVLGPVFVAFGIERAGGWSIWLFVDFTI